MHYQASPAPWMVRHAGLIAPGGCLLDVACGGGRHSLYFAKRGVKVTAVDRDAAALHALRTSLAHAAAAAHIAADSIQIEQRDLEGEPWPYAAASFDAVLVSNYLWRPTASALLETVRVGGAFLYETFMLGNERFGKPSRPDFLLRPHELLDWVGDAFEVIAFEQGEVRDASGTPVAVKQRIATVRRK